MRLVLASASERRVGLLKQAGLKFEICPSFADENSVTDLNASALAAARARLKAEEVFARLKSVGQERLKSGRAEPPESAAPLKSFKLSNAGSYGLSCGSLSRVASSDGSNDFVENSDNLVVLGADTVVFKNGEIFNKPKDNREAETMLKKLSGGEHRVYTAFCLLSDNCKVERCEETVVTFGVFSEQFVSSYIKSGKPLDKAGGYGIQDDEIEPYILKIDGGKDNVIGLPVSAVLKILKEKF